MTPDSRDEWRGLYRAGAMAALAGFVLLPMQIGCYVLWPPTLEVEPLFAVLNENWARGLVGLDVFMLLNSALNLILFAALAAALWRSNRPVVLVTGMLVVVATATHFSSSTAFELLDLARQYAASSDPEIKRQLLAAGRFALAAFQGTAFDIYYVMSAVMLISFGWLMLRAPEFGPLPGWLAVAAGVLMLIPATAGQVGIYLSLASLLPWFFLLFVLWRRLWRLGQAPSLDLRSAAVRA
jgi:hypothetical protein